MVYKASTNANSEFIDRDVLTVSPEGRVINVDRNRGAHTEGKYFDGNICD